MERKRVWAKYETFRRQNNLEAGVARCVGEGRGCHPGPWWGAGDVESVMRTKAWKGGVLRFQSWGAGTLPAENVL